MNQDQTPLRNPSPVPLDPFVDRAPATRLPLIRPEVKESGCLHELFEYHADLNPGATALAGEGVLLSYRELEERANRLAHLLRERGAGPGRLIGLYYHRSHEPIIALLACLKAGAGYVPIDPVHPEERIRHILEESEITTLLTEADLREKAASFFTGDLLATDALEGELRRRPAERPNRTQIGVGDEDIAYVIYTSGTTGRPKGVMAEHGHAYRYALAFNEACDTDSRDRIYQGFSLGFDGSVEEIWMAFSNGATLVVPNRDTARFGDDLARYLREQGVTYFSTVPTLLSTMTEDIPTLRQLVVSGEACPPDLVERWARPGLRMLNVYGPTEATVNTTVAECRPGEPVTIGRPLRGYEIHILDSELQPVAPGEKGELFIGGPTLARGYLKQDALTAEKFLRLPHPAGGQRRLYRTGDLVRYNEQGQIEFFGRIDGQVKIRGYRVELSEIEAVLLEDPGILSAVVRLVEKDGMQQLAAVAVPRDGRELPDRNRVLSLLKKRLPDYMIPAYLDFVDSFPTLASGKVDRRRLPEPIAPLVNTARERVAPATELEVRIADVWRQVLSVPEISVWDHFFRDLGGYSLLAAQMVTRLRAELGCEVAIRDVYRFPNVRELAGHLEAARPATAPRSAPRPTSREVFHSVSPATRAAVYTLQAGSILLLWQLAALPLCALVWLGLGVWKGTLGVLPAAGIVLGMGLVAWPLMLALSIAGKWLLLGRIQPGTHPLWGFYYFRWWLAGRLQAFSGAGLLAGTPLLALYYRCMGARVGRNCSLDTAFCGAWDLVSIGEETSIGADTQLLGYRVENGMLVLGRVDIGKRCFVGLHSALGLNVRMGDDCRLDDQSFLADGTVMADGESRRGSPAQPAEVAVPQPRPGERAEAPPLWFGFLQVASLYALGLALAPLGLLFLGALAASFWWGEWMGALAYALLAVPVGVVVYCLTAAALRRVILPVPRTGVFPLKSGAYLRRWLLDGMMRLNRVALLPLYTTLYLPPWLRLMGARIGRHAELSTIWFCAPELLDIGEESFFADGCLIGGRRTFRGRCEVAVNRVGRRSFVGNGAILPTGKGLGDQCLLGVLSAPPAHQPLTENGTEWLGSPSFSLPFRKKVEGFSDAETYRPTRRLYLQRAVIDGLRVVIPGYLGLAAFAAAVAGLVAAYLHYGWLGLALVVPWLGLGLSFAAILAVIALKWLVMGRFQPVVKPLWCVYVWLNEMINGIYESVMAPALAPFLGTPFIAPWLRFLGIRVGRRTYIASVLFSEFDLVEIGDYAALNVGAVLQTHLFEDRIFKSSRLKIGEGCSVGNMAVVLYDTEMKADAGLASLSLLMKGEVLAPATRWHGIPTVRADY